jgi:ABC-type uncharacterized transport system permease subunit
MTKLYKQSIIIGISGIISLILFLLMQYKSNLLSDRQLISVFFIYIISATIFFYYCYKIIIQFIKRKYQ